MFDTTQVPARERIDSVEVPALLNSGVLIGDDLRRRPLYFNGRFLTAEDLTREQVYFLSRQQDLGHAGGQGVVDGLWVRQGSAAGRIHIDAGHGITALGESVLLTQGVEVDLTDVPEIQRLDAAFGLLRLPREPARNLTGLYIVALRPVEFSANPIASYPTSLEAKRTVEDSEIVEATAITLIPFADNAGAGGLAVAPGRRRSLVAAQIFGDRPQVSPALDGSAPGTTGALPLAMVALSNNVVQWIDNYLVRRDVGAGFPLGQGDVLGLGLLPRATREAHVLQYHEQLDELLADRAAADADQHISAADYFQLLPPVGRMPKGAVRAADFTQIYFPVGVAADLTIVPDDELAALVEESLLLPAIDLSLSAEEQASTSVLVVIPVPRPQVRRLQQQLGTLSRSLRPVAPNLRATFSPQQALSTLKSAALTQAAPVETTRSEADVLWQALLDNASTLWYVRQRNLTGRAAPGGPPVAVELTADERERERNLVNRLREFGLTTRFGNLRRRGTALADAELITTLAAPRFTTSRTLLDAAIRELESRSQGTPGIDRAAVLAVTERFADVELGEGIRRLEAANPNLASTTLSRSLAQSGRVPELDRLARLTPTPRLSALAEELEAVIRAGSPQDVAEFVDKMLKEVAP